MKSSVSHPPTAEGWDPATYPAFAAEFDHYEDLQQAVVDATRSLSVRKILDLGCGTGETLRRLLSVHPNASCIGLDANEEMLATARRSLPADRTTLNRAWIEDTLPPGPFDLVVSVLALHHVDSRGKALAFSRIRDLLAPGARFVLGDVMLTPSSKHKSLLVRLSRSFHEHGAICTVRSMTHRVWRELIPARASRGAQRGQDQPDLLIDQMTWLNEAGLDANVYREWDSLAVITADRASPAAE